GGQKLGCREAAAPQGNPHIVKHTQLSKQLGRLIGAGDAGAGNLMGGEAGKLSAPQANGAVIGSVKSAGKGEDGALARPIWANDAGDAAGLGREGQLDEGVHAPEADREPFNGKGAAARLCGQNGGYIAPCLGRPAFGA